MALPAAIEYLTSQPRWVGWKWVRDAKGDLDKPLFRPTAPERFASTQRPETWASYELALSVCKAGQLDGIGYVLRDDDTLLAIDLDDCRNPKTGEIADWAQYIVDEANSYTEITPSQCGLRILGRPGVVSTALHKAYKLPGGGHGEIFYRAARYITVTGHRLDGTPDSLEDIGDIALQVLVNAGKMKAGDTGAEEHRPNQTAEASLEDVRAALAVIPNPDLHWDDWTKIGLAIYRATGGSEEGREAWRDWSAKSPKHHDDDLTAKWSQFHRSPPQRIGFGSLCYMAQQADPFFLAPSWENRDPFGEAAGDEPEQPTDSRPQTPLKFVYFDQVAPNLDAADFVEGLLIEGGMSVIYGPSNCGKTFFMTDLALHVATGQKWRGRAIEAGAVIYCALEGSHGISNRVAAFKREKGLDGCEVPFGIIPVAMDLLDPGADAAKLVKTIELVTEEMGVKPKLIVLDTLSRAMAGGNENSPEDMGALVRNGDLIRQKLKAHIAWIHHSGKDQAAGARGHSLLRAATDTEIEITRENPDAPSVAKVMKQREMEIDGTFAFKLVPVTLGQNRRGKDVTSCIVAEVDGVNVKTRLRLSAGARAALVALREANAKEGRQSSSRDIPEGVQVVSVEAWRREFYSRSVLDNPDARRKAFQRATRELIETQTASVINNLAWIIRGSENDDE